MGGEKQLLVYQGKSLIQRAVETALSAGYPVTVVLGAYKQKILPELIGYPIDYLTNHHWAVGISSSIKAGLSYINDHHAEIDGVLITLADQPRINKQHLTKIFQSATNSSTIVATRYQGIDGVPAFFPKKFFKLLNQLEGDSGARRIIKQHPNHVKSIDFPAASFDIDTKQDWKDFLEGGLES